MPYNGWTNYETWCVNLWIRNEEGSYNYWKDTTKEIYKESKESLKDGIPYINKIDNALFALSERMKEEFQEGMPDLGCTVWADLLQSSLSEVNWSEIAGHMLEDMED